MYNMYIYILLYINCYVDNRYNIKDIYKTKHLINARRWLMIRRLVEWMEGLLGEVGPQFLICASTSKS